MGLSLSLDKRNSDFGGLICRRGQRELVKEREDQKSVIHIEEGRKDGVEWGY